MSDDPLTPPALPAVVGLTGKMPAHGDFVRRGDRAITGRYDRWLSAALAEAAGLDGETLAARLDAMPSWRFAAPDGDNVIAGAMIASRDKVGRRYPLVGFAVLPGASRTTAEVWCAQVEAVLIAARDASDTADMLAEALSAIEVAPDPERVPINGQWWRQRGADRIDGPAAALPTGPDFDGLLHGDAAAEPGDATS